MDRVDHLRGDALRRAGIDSGSRWLGLTICVDADGPHVLSYVFADALTVGREVPRAVPRLVTPKPKTEPDGTITEREPYYLMTTREVTEDHEREAASAVMALLIEHGVEVVTIEKISHLHGGKGATVQGVVAQGTETNRTKGVYTRIAERCEARGIEVRYVLAATWRARLLPMVKAEAEMTARREGQPAPEGSAIKRRGTGLDPIARLGIAGWPSLDTWKTDKKEDKKAEHVLDAAGLLLAEKAPAPVSKRTARAASAAARGPRVKREKRAAPRGDRIRGKMGPTDLAKYRATDRARYARTKGAERAAARIAAGCDCREPGKRARGRCKVTCASRPPPGYKGIRAAGLR